MSRQLLFNNDSDFLNGTATGSGGTGGETIDNPNDVPEGRVVAFDADDVGEGILALDAAIPDTVHNIVFVQGAASGEEPIFSPVFNKADIKAGQVNSRVYVAPVAQVSTVTAETGTGYATVRVVQVNTGFKPNRRITATVKITGLTAANIATALAAAINAKSPNFVTATTDTADLILTGDLGVSFETSLDDEAEGWTLAATTTPNFGSGTPAQVAEMEEIAYGGNFTNRIYLPISPVKYAQALNYDIFTILVPTNTTPNIAKSNKYHEIRIAAETEAAEIDLDTFFGV